MISILSNSRIIHYLRIVINMYLLSPEYNQYGSIHIFIIIWNYILFEFEYTHFQDIKFNEEKNIRIQFKNNLIYKIYNIFWGRIMGDELRKSGLKLIADVPWGTHFCQFYLTKLTIFEISIL